MSEDQVLENFDGLADGCLVVNDLSVERVSCSDIEGSVCCPQPLIATISGSVRLQKVCGPSQNL